MPFVQPLRFRPAEPSDVVRLARFQVKAWMDNYSAFLPSWTLQAVTLEHRIEAWRLILGRRSLRYGDTRVVLAEKSDDLLGFGAIAPQPVSSRKTQGYDHDVCALYVRSDVQRRGVGRRMMRQLFRDISAGGGLGATVSVMRANTAGRAFLSALGAAQIDDGPGPAGHVLGDVTYGFRRLDVASRAQAAPRAGVGLARRSAGANSATPATGL